MTVAEVLFAGLLAHLIGDYLIQSHWMATEKTKRWWPAVAHALTYGLPFLAITRNPLALAVIVGTHAVIDRYRLARHLAWAKNHLGPWRHELLAEVLPHGRVYRWHPPVPPWSESKATGYPPDTPPWLAVWLMTIADNTLHLLINSAALWWAVSL